MTYRDARHIAELEAVNTENAALRAENAALEDTRHDLWQGLWDTADAYHQEVGGAGFPVSFFHCHHEVCMQARALLSPLAVADPIVEEPLTGEPIRKSILDAEPPCPTIEETEAAYGEAMYKQGRETR